MKTQLSTELSTLFEDADDVIHVKKNTYLFHEGDPVKELYLLKSGKIKISKLSNNGSELTLRLCSTGDLVGELSLDDDHVPYIQNAQTLMGSKLAVISKEKLKNKLLDNSNLALQLLQAMSDYARRDQTRFRDLVMFGKKGALYSTLIRLANSYGQINGDRVFINMRLTDQTLADFCGTSRESVNRLMSELRRAHIITTEKGYITIHDIDYLKREINCGDCPIHLCSIH
ncbi:Crp/Fnr family transcriptional regulator [Lentibacillus saliphilus]|uniref:Crp/Fnr family transcriptional regulator n=1 Tax=Lentibacillus saliphilus TaxID=2737028 RepID=UPI001FEBD6AA|nr:Crp/Fnr family transcriptional regulator [Lentibacillus saliphilus]